MSDIDREIAEKVMGWKLYSSPSTRYGDEWCTMDDRGIIFRTLHYPVFEWHPSTRIDHAWEVVEKLRIEGHDIDIQFAHDDLMVWTAQVADNTASCAETAPLAICKAALEAKGKT